MKAVIQIVNNANLTVDNKLISEIGYGYVIYLGVKKGDTKENADYFIKKITALRIFEDENGKMNLSLREVNGSILSISQFTLYANTNDGNRPSFVNALNPILAKELYLKFNDELRTYGYVVEEGIFGAHMDIELLNSGPCTIIYEF